ncbi:ubiquitin-like-conjugating enzyme ATG10 isoform X1 [Biomphalaria glabrata]|uniref:Ubiquitin-like-conjugating enzyme ATG10 n=1 Tax=Biomphalaria glabrata TaxID=6526 RepID=A0A2C9LV01_BIOGL|nr:ubiquitin-like-conjugating enzyme ATG10 isoform X1 [Biomphalaria glabrata]KAI8750112.1 ubiquitin-like-conjugating enzyme ATG10 isoform X1 [Biomphalaria glabrata]KAI8787386.1 ubiquitin-conjugating enzyme ATG10 isoform X1 [Biomphalaria glabrata]
MAAGSISRDEFQSLVKKFVDISNKIDDKWHLVTASSSTYMLKKMLATTVCCNRLENISNQMVSDMEIESLEDVSCMPDVSESKTLTYEYHVVYNESYAVPVLYFNIFTNDGRLLPLDEVWSQCPTHYQTHLKDNKWSTLTQQEHPLLGRPFLQLHPCHTADFMAQVISKSSQKINYLACWLSTVGPMVGLNIPSDYMCKD